MGKLLVKVLGKFVPLSIGNIKILHCLRITVQFKELIIILAAHRFSLELPAMVLLCCASADSDTFLLVLQALSHSPNNLI